MTVIIWNKLFILLIVVIILLCIVIGIIDSLKYLIPDLCIILLTAAVLAFNLFFRYQHLYRYILSCLFFFCIYLFIFIKIGGLGFGDVKYAAASGLLLGFYFGIGSFIFGTVLAMVYALIISADSAEISINRIKIPYGSFLSISTIVFFILQLLKQYE